MTLGWRVRRENFVMRPSEDILKKKIGGNYDHSYIVILRQSPDQVVH